MKKKTKETVGQKLLAVIISEQLGISVDRAMKCHVLTSEIHPSWEALGENLLNRSVGEVKPTVARALSSNPIAPNASLRSRGRRRLPGGR